MRDGEVNEGDTRAQVGGEVASRVSRGHEKRKGRTEVNLVASCGQKTKTYNARPVGLLNVSIYKQIW